MVVERPANSAGFAVEGAELYFLQDKLSYPDSRISRYTFAEGPLKGKHFVVRPATRFLFKVNHPYVVNLRWNRAGTILVASPVKPELMEEQERRLSRVVKPAEFERLPRQSGEQPIFRHKRLGCIVFLAEDMQKMPAPETEDPMVMIGTMSSVAFVTQDPRLSKALSEYTEDTVEKVDWMSDLSLPWRPMNEATFQVGVFDEKGRFVRLEEGRLIEGILGLPRRAMPGQIDDLGNACLRQFLREHHPDRYEARRDLTAGQKVVWLEAYQHNQNILKGAIFQMHQRAFYLRRQEQAATARAAELTERIKMLKVDSKAGTVAKPSDNGRRKGIDAHKAKDAWLTALKRSGIATTTPDELVDTAIKLVAYGHCSPDGLELDNAAAIQLLDAAGVPADSQIDFLCLIRREYQGIKLEISEENGHNGSKPNVPEAKDETPPAIHSATAAHLELLNREKIGREKLRPAIAEALAQATKATPAELKDRPIEDLHREIQEAYSSIELTAGRPTLARLTGAIRNG